MASRSFEIGALYRKQYRGLLTAMKWDGDIEDFIEDKGWITSQFTIKGITPEANARIGKLYRQLEAEEQATDRKRKHA